MSQGITALIVYSKNRTTFVMLETWQNCGFMKLSSFFAGGIIGTS